MIMPFDPSSFGGPVPGPRRNRRSGQDLSGLSSIIVVAAVVAVFGLALLMSELRLLAYLIRDFHVSWG